MVCLSGTFCDKALWQSQVQALNGGYDFIFPSIATHDDMATLAQSILDTLPDTFCLMGMSAGAVVALEIVRQAPERVEKICLVAANPSGANSEMLAGLDKQLKTVKTLGIDGYFKEKLLPKSLAPMHCNDNEITDSIVTMAHRVGVDAFSKQIQVLKSRHEYWQVLQKINIPVLAVCGECDTICPPENHRRIVEQTQNGRMVILPNTGHYINIENPHGLNQALVNFF